MRLRLPLNENKKPPGYGGFFIRGKRVENVLC